ncbi:CIC11C00000003669 [Sungouiella intermedia]|uniref:CIC11C00000003669 n=1 Tax=Sungouiella intermedia TaxID=45354 RepID=A0A1L0B975_9ASCO|nr:CIC11C00000003669 [[Candida] intermedia]
MPEILVDTFPFEVIDTILLFLSKKALRTFYSGLSQDSELRQLVLSRMYKEIRVEEPDQLVEAVNTNVRIGTMRWNYQEKHLSFFKEYPSLASNIADVKLKVGAPYDYTILEKIPLTNISHLEVTKVKSFKPSLVPRTLKLIELSFLAAAIPMRMDGWPPLLSSLKIVNYNNLSLIELPESLRELTCEDLYEAWDRFPSKLEKLTLHYVKELPLERIDFPELLEELRITRCSVYDIEKLVTRLPQKLKKIYFSEYIADKISSLEFPDSVENLSLKFCNLLGLEGFRFPKSLIKINLNRNDVKKMQNLQYPESLRVLYLEECEITTLDDFEFPSLLRELYLSYNPITSLTGVRFPELEVLDLTTFSATNELSMRNVRLPSTLKVLKANGLVINDYVRSRFPPSLIELEVAVSGNWHSMRLPPSLQSFKLTVPLRKGKRRGKDKAEGEFNDNLSHLNFPTTLQLLIIENGRSIDFDCRLPFLQRLGLHDFEGLVKVPQSVNILSVDVRHAHFLKGIDVSQKLEVCNICCLKGSFNEEIKNLKDYQNDHGLN